MGGGENREVIVYVRVRQPRQKGRRRRNGRKEGRELLGWEDWERKGKDRKTG